MTPRIFAVALLACFAVSSIAVRADEERLKNAEAVLTEMASAGDKGIPLDLLKKAKCAVIVPSVRKFALGIGGQYGRGYASCRRPDGSGWTAPGSIGIEGGSVGLQIGGSATDLILLVMNDRGMDRLLSSKFTLGADASVAAGPVGRRAQAETDVTLMAEILAWSRSRGLFAGISLQGSTMHEDGDENKALYGKEITNKDILRGGDVPVPAAAAALIKALSKF